MRISASLGVLMATSLLGHSASQATDYGKTNGSPIGSLPDGSGNVITGNNGGVPGNLPYPSNAAGSVPGPLPSGVGPVGPVSPSDDSNGLPPTVPVGGPGNLPGSGSSGGGPNGMPPNGPAGGPGNLPGPLSPSDGSNGLPPNGPGGIPGPLPGNSPSIGPGNAPGNVPSAGSVITPGSLPTKIPQNVPGAPDSLDSDISNIPTCPLRSTRTVVVTVYPTDSQSESDFHWPDDSDSDGSNTSTPMPTKPPGVTSLASNSGIPIFTTLTLDIWGPGGSPSNSDSSNNGDTGPGSESGEGNNDGTHSHNGNGPDSDGENDSHNNPDSPFFSPTPVPNGAPQYSDSTSGVNTLQPTPLQTPGFPDGGAPGNQPQFPSAGPAQEASDSLPVTTQAGAQGQDETSPWFTNIPGGKGAGQPYPSYITIIGQDGRPTVVSSGANAIPGNAQPSETQGSPQNGNSPDLPGGLSSGFPIPPPAFTGIPGSQNPSNSPAGSLPGSGPDAGITTCATFTITGTNGLPTVVDSTWVVPFSNPSLEDSSQLPVTFDPQAPLSTISAELGIPTIPVPVSGSSEDGFGGSAMTTSTSFTMIGADGNPTVVYTTWNIPAATASSEDPGDNSGHVSSGDFMTITELPPLGSSAPGGEIPTVPGSDDISLITTCTSYTVIGPNGLPTVIDSTFVIPGPANTGATIGGDPELPSGASNVLPNGATSPATFQITNTPEIPSSIPTDVTGSEGFGSGGITTCTSYTMIGSDGLPTVVDTTWVIPGSANTQSELPGNPSFVSDSSPSGLPTGFPGPLTSSAGTPSDGNQGSVPGVTTCITYTTIGQDGLPTDVDTTFVIPLATATLSGTSLTLPTVNGDGQTDSSSNPTGAYTTTATAAILGPDGNPTPTVQTIVFSDSSALGVSAGDPQGATSEITPSGVSGPVFTSGDLNPLSSDTPSLNGYDDGISDASISAILTDGSAAAEGTSVTGTTTGTLTWTVTSITNPPGGPIFSDGAAQPPFVSNPSGDGTSDAPDGPAQPAYGSVATESTLWPLSAVQTSTWTNVIEAETTSYTFNYPLTTLATLNVPMRRLARRQAMTAWSNSTTSSLSATSASTATISEVSSPTICPAGGSIGNTTIDFDNSKPGPLFNPVENIWFSGGFLIAPPTSQQPQPYIPSSGGQLVEFVPPALSNTTTTISGDVAQIGVGPHAASPCFRFDFFGANLGCDARGDEKWCEFDISAYRWNETSSTEESIAWSETKQVPACPKFSEGGYQLTRVDLDGYKDLSSILITLRVSSNLRVWWGDDFRVGWSDNSCIAASCRANAPSQFAKRETIISALRQGVYRWTPYELKRLDDSLVWESAN